MERQALKKVVELLQAQGYACVNLGGCNGTIALHFLNKEDSDYIQISVEEMIDDEVLCDILGVNIENYEELTDEILTKLIKENEVSLEYNEYGLPYIKRGE